MDKDDLEKRVSELLELVAGEGIKELFEDARNILNSDNFSAPEKAIGNYLREVQSALFAITVNLAKSNTDVGKYEIEAYCSRTGRKITKLTNKSQINLVIDYFNLNLKDSQIDFWKNIELHKLAHRSGLKPNKRISKAFIENIWMPYLVIILEFAEGINKTFLNYYTQLELLAKNPTTVNREIVLQEIPNNPHLRTHFFENIENFSVWLTMLKSKKIFEEVPEEYANEGGYLKIQAWPPLSFLISIASKTEDDTVLASVAEIASTISETKNLRVNDDLLLLAGKLPAKLAAKFLIPRIKAAIETKGLYTMGEKLSGLLLKLNEGGFNEELVEVAEKIISDEKFNPFFEETYISNNMNFYYYDGLLTVLTGINDVDIFKLFLNRVIEGLTLSFKDSETEKYHTMHWNDVFNDEVEKDELSLMYVSKLFLTAKNLISSGASSTEEVTKLISEANKEKWHIIDSLILNLLENHEGQTDDELRQELHKRLISYEESRRNYEKPEANSIVDVSPYSDEELSVLSAVKNLDELVKYDGPNRDIWNGGPSKAGLVQSIFRQIKHRPNEFVRSLEAFKKLTDNDYVDLVYALSQAEFKVDKEYEENYLSIVDEFIEQRYDHTKKEIRQTFSRGIFSVYRSIYSNSKNYLSMDSDAFRALDKIIKDQSMVSTIQSSKRDDRFYMLATQAINTPSIEAFSCLMGCYLTPNTKWCDIRKRKDIDEFKSYVLTVVQANESAPFRFEAGRKIHFLLGLDEQWFVNDLKKIVFNKDFNDPWEAFVAGMMAQSYICNDVLDDVYRDAIRYISTEEYISNHQERDNFAIEKGITRHISFYYCQLDDNTCTEDSLTNYIFVNGSQALRRLFLVETKKQFKKDGNGEKAFDRVKELIDWRYNELKDINFDPDKIQELSGFFSLFPVIVKFNPEWSLKYLCEFMNILRTNGGQHYADLIIDALIEQAQAWPFLTSQCLLSWVKNLKDEWHDFNDVKKLIKELHQTGDTQTLVNLKEIVSRLSSKGICPDLIGLFT